MFKHPIDSIGNLLNVIYIIGVGSQFPFTEEHKIYVKMIEQVCSKVCEKCEKFQNGDSVVRTRMTGKLVGELLTFLVSTKGVDKATKIIKTANSTGKLSEVLSKINETTKFDNIVKSLEIIEATAKVKNSIKNSIGKLNELITKVYNYANGCFDVEFAGIGKIELDTTEILKTATRNKYAQKIVGRLYRKEVDHGGHLIASIFDGSGNLNQGSWKRMEEYWAKALNNNQKVSVDIKIGYDNINQRPTDFIIKYTIDEKSYIQTFENIDGQTFKPFAI